MNYPIRILHVIGIMNRGGAEAVIMNLYRNIDRSKIQFDFVENSFEPAAYDEEIEALGGRIFRCPHYNGKNHFEYKKWWNDFFDEHGAEYRIVHGHLGSTAAIYLHIAKKYGLYTIAHSHNANSGYKISDIIYSAYSYPTRFVADKLFACSRAAGISRYGSKRGGDESCTVLNNAIDTKMFAYAPDVRRAMRDSMGIADKLVFGHVGRFFGQKNHTFLIDIFKEIHLINPEAVLILIGDGELRPQIEQKISELGLTDSVILTGVKSNVNEYYQAMDAFIMPSLYEGLPVTLVEAQSSGLPCFVSSDAITREVTIIDSLTFISLEEPAEKWAELIMAGLSGANQREDCTQKVAEAGYDISETARWLSNFYLEVAENE